MNLGGPSRPVTLERNVCVPAPSCRAALKEATALFPGRRTTSDGICPSAEHILRSPVSDHNQGEAVDVSHDPRSGCDCQVLVDQIVSRRDERVKYVIHNRRIWRSYDKPNLPAWTPQEYWGENPHVTHMHISIKPDSRNDVSPWFEEDGLKQEDRDFITKSLADLQEHFDEEIGKVYRQVDQSEENALKALRQAEENYNQANIQLGRILKALEDR